MRSSTLLPLFGLASTAFSTGTFLTPSGTDGSLSVTSGDTIDISWTNTSDYDVLSIGYYSTSNQTITWVIANSQSHPTSYRWTVDAVAEGFNLADSKLFAFYGCKDYNFGDPFISSYFVINDASNAASSSSSSASSSTTATSTTAFSTITSSSVTATSTLPSSITPSNTPTSTAAASSSASSSSSSGLSTGAKVGLAVGIVLGVAAIAAIVTLFLLRRRKQRNYGPKQLSEADSLPPQTSAYEKSHVPKDHKDAPYTGLHEAPGSAPGHVSNGAPVELGTSQASENGIGRVELPAGR